MPQTIEPNLKSVLETQLAEVQSARAKMADYLKSYTDQHVGSTTTSYLELCAEERILTEWIQTGVNPRNRTLTR